MVRALIQLIFTPRIAWEQLSADAAREQFLMYLLVYPMLILTALSAYVHHWYGYTTIEKATQEALVTLLKYAACIISMWIIMVKPCRQYYAAEYSKSQAHIFVGYTYIISMLSVIINNLLPCDFAFVQFLPVYIIWVVFQGQTYLKIPQENVFSYTVITSVLFLGLPFVWDKVFDFIIQ